MTPVERWRASLPQLPPEPTLSLEAMPDYGVSAYNYSGHTPCEIATWWGEDEGDGLVHNCINHILDVQRARMIDTVREWTFPSC